ncbi:TonB-dependent siderophore receptor [Denitromonas iodatirespirans]|uniref:TonB-dependent receptor n=1 Tax=Denitromonas iodatirespirans TaxID=2795389 RepID=A0A944H6S4_DENI1|nr:TonB-dependent receptor [Denitromonas iodatirespirans]MBT0960458.1 TonB-dependent receptor [Denitromonas iodatirespirans]
MRQPSLCLKPLAVATAFALFSIGVVAPLHAQQGTAAVDISLKAQPLGAALNELAKQAGLQLLVNPDLLTGKQAPAVTGDLTVRQALDQVLAGSGLAARIDGSSVVILPRPGAAGLNRDVQLAEVIVRAGSEPISRYSGASSNAAARLPADPMDLPVAGVSIPRAVIEDQGVIRAAEAVRNVSGVTRNPAYVGFTDSYRVRGFLSDTGLWNGFRRDFYFTFTDTAHLERVEVIKGPASVTYGDLEPGGIINYVTKRPSRNPVNSVQLTVGSDNLLRPEFDVGATAGEDRSVRMRFTGAFEQADSFRDHVDNRHATLGATLDWDIQPDTRLALSGYWLDSTNTADRGFTNDAGPIVLKLPRSRFLDEPKNRYDFEQTDLSAVLNHRLDAAWSVRGGVNWYRADSVRDSIENGQLSGQTMFRQYVYMPQTDENTTVFAELRGDLHLAGTIHTLVAGIEQVDKAQSYDFRRNFNASGTPFYPIDIFNPVYGQYPRERGPQDRYDIDTQSRSLYVQDLIELGEHWRILAGLRYTWYEQRNRARDQNSDTSLDKSETTPRLGVLYKFNPEHSIFASYGRSFTPQFANYAQLAPGTSPTPERGEQYEAGYKYTSLDESVIAGVTLFQIVKENVATTDPSDSNQLILSGEQRVRGIEFDLNAKLGDGWSLIGSYAHLQAELTQDTTLPVGDRLLNTPRNQASLWVRHDFRGLPGVGIGVGAFYVGKREAELPNTWQIPAYTRIDASAYWKIDRQTDLALHIKNVTDKTYYDTQGNYLYPGAPRSAMLALRYTF